MSQTHQAKLPPPRNLAANSCTVQRLHHVGIAVRSLDDAVGRFRRLFGLGDPVWHESKERGIRAAVINAGGANLELLQPTSDASPFTRFLADHGEGLHHICLAVADVRKASEFMGKSGVKLTNSEPVAGFNGHFVFTDPASTHGVRFELSQLYPDKSDS
jgi:methylmalonyl-CoA/ethylmalonyl-CoA epimerase